jgi:hypothetical protein
MRHVFSKHTSGLLQPDNPTDETSMKMKTKALRSPNERNTLPLLPSKNLNLSKNQADNHETFVLF